MLPQTQFILVVILLLVALLVLTVEMRDMPQTKSNLPEEQAQNPASSIQQDETWR